MIKLQTGVSTNMDFIKAMKERGQDVNAMFPAETLRDQLDDLSEETKVTFESTNETVLASVNEEEPGPTPTEATLEIFVVGLHTGDSPTVTVDGTIYEGDIVTATVELNSTVSVVVECEDYTTIEDTVEITEETVHVEYSMEPIVPRVVSVSVTKTPDITDYFVTEIPDYTGIEVTATYSDGTIKEVDHDDISFPEEGKKLTKEDTVLHVQAYSEFFTEFNITVSDPVYSIELSKPLSEYNSECINLDDDEASIAARIFNVVQENEPRLIPGTLNFVYDNKTITFNVLLGIKGGAVYVSELENSVRELIHIDGTSAGSIDLHFTSDFNFIDCTDEQLEFPTRSATQQTFQGNTIFNKIENKLLSIVSGENLDDSDSGSGSGSVDPEPTGMILSVMTSNCATGYFALDDLGKSIIYVPDVTGGGSYPGTVELVEEDGEFTTVVTVQQDSQ